MDDLNDSALAYLPPLAPEDDPASRYQTIRKWSVVGNDRLMGNVYNRPGQADGRTIMTSPVVQVRLMGGLRTPVAFTESGNAYWLAEPAANYSMDRAEQFIWSKSRRAAETREREQPDPLLQTTMMRLV